MFERIQSGPQTKNLCKWQVMWSWIGAFFGIGLVSILSGFVLNGTGLTLIIGSFGASAVLIYGAVVNQLSILTPCQRPKMTPKKLKKYCSFDLIF